MGSFNCCTRSSKVSGCFKRLSFGRLTLILPTSGPVTLSRSLYSLKCNCFVVLVLSRVRTMPSRNASSNSTRPHTFEICDSKWMWGTSIALVNWFAQEEKLRVAKAVMPYRFVAIMCRRGVCLSRKIEGQLQIGEAELCTGHF